jgi:hypothetical protein
MRNLNIRRVNSIVIGIYDTGYSYYLGFPIWFVVHDWRGLFFVILVMFVLLHSFATHFFNPSPVFLRRGGLPLTILVPMPGFFLL